MAFQYMELLMDTAEKLFGLSLQAATINQKFQQSFIWRV
jgi:hypothetical protein